jgi:hypothetical protein
MKLIDLSEAQREEVLQEARMFTLIAPHILPLLERRKNNATGKILQSFRSGRADYLTLVAELSVLVDLEQEINQKCLLYNTIEESSHGNARK